MSNFMSKCQPAQSQGIGCSDSKLSTDALMERWLKNASISPSTWMIIN